MQPVNDYIDSFDGVKKEWLATFVAFMRESFPDAEEKISFPLLRITSPFIH